jgi:hypothetical protein
MIQYIRHGKCKPDECNSLCCKVMERSDEIIQLDKNGICTKLKNNMCSLQTKNKPNVCKEWPRSPHDPIFLKVKEKCGFWFEIKEEPDEDDI